MGITCSQEKQLQNKNKLPGFIFLKKKSLEEVTNNIISWLVVGHNFFFAPILKYWERCVMCHGGVVQPSGVGLLLLLQTFFCT